MSQSTHSLAIFATPSHLSVTLVSPGGSVTNISGSDLASMKDHMGSEMVAQLHSFATLILNVLSPQAMCLNAQDLGFDKDTACLPAADFPGVDAAVLDEITETYRAYIKECYASQPAGSVPHGMGFTAADQHSETYCPDDDAAGSLWSIDRRERMLNKLNDRDRDDESEWS